MLSSVDHVKFDRVRRPSFAFDGVRAYARWMGQEPQYAIASLLADHRVLQDQLPLNIRERVLYVDIG